LITDEHLKLNYETIILETDALLGITQHSKNFDVIILTAGALHLVNLEKWLFQLGYKIKKNQNLKTIENLQALEQLNLEWFSIELDSVIKQRELPSRLIDIKSTSFELWKNCIETESLIPIETFSWINKNTKVIEDISAPAKRKAQQIDDTEKKKEAPFTPKRTQPARICNKITKYPK